MEGCFSWNFLQKLEKIYLGMKNILFIAPHPDDEIVGAAFIIKNFKKKNVIIFFPTNG